MKKYRLKNIVLILGLILGLVTTTIWINLLNKKTIDYTNTYIENNIDKIKKEIGIGQYDSALKLVKDSVGKIPKDEYPKQYKLIWDIISQITDIPEGREYALNIFHEIENSKKLSQQDELYINNRIKTLYILNENYAKSSEYILKTIESAIKVKNTYEDVRSRIELGVIYGYLGGYETGIKIIESTLDITNENKDKDADMKVYAYLNLAEIYMNMENFDKCKEFCDLIPKYEKYFSLEDYRDIDIFKNIIDAKVDIHNNELDIAKSKLNYADKLIKEDTQESIADKDIEHLIATAKYHYKSKDYYKALDIYNNTLDLCEIKKKNIYSKAILYDLVRLSNDLNRHDLRDIYYENIISIMKKEDDIRYRDYSYYILEHSKKENEIINDINKTKLIYSIVIVLIITIGILMPLAYKKIMKMKYRSTHDGLTNSLNRYSLDKKYKSIINKNEEFAIIILDIDNFKKINDTYGHAFGDIVLVNMCKAIRSLLNKDANLYRYGGEEFIVLGKYKSEEDITDLAENIRYYVEQMKWKEGITVTVSIGVAYSKKHGIHTIEKADENLYKAKGTGKNKVIIS